MQNLHVYRFFLAVDNFATPIYISRCMNRLIIILVFTTVGLLSQAFAQSTSHQITVDLKKIDSPWSTAWTHFGYDEPNYTYMKDGKKLLSELAALSPVPVYVRVHNLLTTGNGEAALKWGSTNAYTETKRGKPVYNWQLVDSIMDVFVERGMKPVVEIGFMPEALSRKPQPYRHTWQPGVDYNKIYTGWAYPPADYKKWGELVYQWVKHSMERYGKDEVRTWWWEVWNEPNIGYWQGTPEEFNMLYDYAVDGVKRAMPEAKVGGPSSTGPGWNKAADFLRNFLKHCEEGTNYATGKKGSPLDFISFHAKGSPKVMEGHVVMNMATQLNDVAKGFDIVSKSVFKQLPILITEFDPEGCAACGMATNPENAYRNGTMYSSYTAASFTRLYDLAKRYKIYLEGVTSWSFEFEGQPWFYGFRDLATNGVDKPVLNVFRMFGMMKGNRIEVENSHEIALDSILTKGIRKAVDIHALATAADASIALMVWNYHDADVPRAEMEVVLNIKNIPAEKVMLSHFRIDRDHSNAYEVWKSMGSPQNVNETQFKMLERAGQLELLKSPEWVITDKGHVYISVTLPAQAVSLIKLEYK
jgi:xylan 1,4-beta-xylosidase